MASQSSQLCRLGQVETAVRRLVATSTRFDHEAGVRAGLTLSSYEADFVNLLLLHGPLSPGQLGQLSGISSSGTITGVIDRLERAGYVRRARCTVDQRKVDRRKVFVVLDLDRLGVENAPRSQRLAAIVRDYDDGQLAIITEFLSRVADAETAAISAETDSASTAS